MECAFEKVSSLFDDGEEFQTEKVSRNGYQLKLLACIVNQLHRIAIGMPIEEIPGGMPISQLTTLGFLYFTRKEDIYQRDLESFFKLRRSTVSSQLDTLEKRGLIQRVAVPHDARLKKLVLTEKGVRIGDQVLQNLGQVNTLLIRGLNQEEVTVLTELLEKLEKNLSQTAL